MQSGEVNRQRTASIILAGGCFWGLQAFLRRLPGVLETEAGYANSLVPAPTYEQVCSQRTHAVEAVKVVYDSDILTLRQLLDAYFAVIDPTAVNRQGNDTGTNYRTGIYYSDPADLPVIQTAVKTEERRYVHPLATEVLPLKNYYPAEGYHQDYLEVPPGGYCHISPVLIHGFRLKSPEELAKEDGNGQ
nr:peptide-methionine (S)-S-oxide reductase MsrA [Faecalibaculum rodentium]